MRYNTLNLWHQKARSGGDYKQRKPRADRLPASTIRAVHARGVTIIWIEHVVHALLAVVDRLIVIDFGRTEQGVLVAEFDLDEIDRERAAWGFFRDRRTDLYDILT